MYFLGYSAYLVVGVFAEHGAGIPPDEHLPGACKARVWLWGSATTLVN